MSEIAFEKALDAMRSPSQMGIICVDITNKCDLHCSNCTRLLANQDRFYDMTLENFRLAVRSLRDYPGTIAVIGGNPCMHRDFEGICRVFVEEIPDKERRGLWTNNVFKYADLAKETFGVFNLNPHNDDHGIASLEPLKELGWYYSGNSEHASLLAAVQDFHAPEAMWSLISQCDINQHWSASIVQNNGKLRAYFCEVAASFDLARGEDHGLEVSEGWWRRPLRDFSEQIEYFCPKCGVPGRIAAFKDSDETDSYSATNADLALKSEKKKKRKIIEIKPESEVKKVEHRVTQYSTNLYRKKPKIAVITPYYKESIGMLKQCHESVLAQEVDAEVVHFMVADGYANNQIDGWGVEHIKLPRSHGNNGNTPRAIGALLAEGKGVDFIAFLDADNWYHPQHLSTLLAVNESTGAEVCCSWRTFHRPDGSSLGISEPAEEQLQHVDTSCYLLARSAFSINLVWSQMPNEVSAICDRIFLQAIVNKKLNMAFTRQRTVAFRTTYPGHYPTDEQDEVDFNKSIGIGNAQRYLLSADGVRYSVSRLGFWPQP
ncbi:glycosyltransferase [Herbaspirillum rubrisubalbicans]|uniref:glycosyltransferase n=1 Tax=Herbaspirillum rubrisubalbicans TaxID=80842 RepID=UPI000DD4B192|nr:glycosyltransferase [Herbaspirillum rubrisubalbicans]